MTFIIAEAGANHNRDWDTACRLVEVAHAAGADAVKFQTYSSETMYSRHTPDFAGYRNIPALIKANELPREWQGMLKIYCDDIGIEFMSTPFDEAAVDELLSLGVKRLKVSAFEALDPRFMDYVACAAEAASTSIVFSAGVGSSTETVARTLERIRDRASVHVTVLHCNSAYPTPMSDINLRQMHDLLDLLEDGYYNVSVGLSDHTMSTLVPALAASMGANTIEKHFTLDRGQQGPDHPFALEPIELEEMVKNVRLAQCALGVRRDSVTPSEKLGQTSMALRSVVTRRTLRKGESLDATNVTTKRPCPDDAVPALSYYDVLESYVTRHELEDDAVVRWSDIEPCEPA